MNIPGTYAAEVAGVIRSIRRGCLLPPMTPIELDPIVQDWVETFWGIIPENQIRPAFILAKQNPNRKPEDKKFPLKDTEVLDAFYKLRAAGESRVASCKYCDLYEHDPTEYPRCPFHILNELATEKGLQL